MILLHLPKNPIFTTVYISHIWAEIRKRTDINFKQATSLSVKGQQCHAIKLTQAAYMVSATPLDGMQVHHKLLCITFSLLSLREKCLAEAGP